MRKIFESEKINGKQTKVYGPNVHGEFVVKFYRNGEHMDASDYFTDDKDDALATARHAMDGEKKWNK